MGTHPTRTPTATAATRPRPERPRSLTARAAQFPPETPSRGFAATACWGNRLPGCSPGGGSGGPFRCRGLGKRWEHGLGGSEQTKPGGTLPSTMSRNDRSVISEGQPHQPHRRRAGNSRRTWSMLMAGQVQDHPGDLPRSGGLHRAAVRILAWEFVYGPLPTQE